MDLKNILIRRLKEKEAVIAIVGLGYVGLPLALRYNEVGFRVLGVDVDQEKVEVLNSGRSYIEHIPSSGIKRACGTGFVASADFGLISEVDVVILCVPTPLNNHREPDISFIINTMDSIKPYLHEGQLISLESTTYPGTSEEELLPRMQEKELVVGDNIFLVYSPEREDPGNKSYNINSIPKVVGGHTEHCLEAGVVLYEQAIDHVVPVSSTKTAEMTKLLENIHRAVNIGLVNEMKIVADRMGIDIFEVIDAAATKPFGFTPYYPGPGLGGHCIPIDPFYLTWKAREYGLHTRFIELSGEVNSAMPEYVLGKIIDGLNRQGKALNNSKVLVLGIAYKKNVGDMRESPSVEIMKLIKSKGGDLSYSDPHVPVFPKMRKYVFELSSIDISKEILMGFDAVVIATNHDKFDYNLIRESSQLIVDCRGVYRDFENFIIKA